MTTHLLARASTAALLALALFISACGGGTGSPPPGEDPPDEIPPTQLGDPIPGLTADELASFERGRVLFSKRFRPSEGLGPFYNATSCASCHSTPVPGGSARLYRNFLLAVWGPPVQQGSIPPFLSPVVPAFGSGAAHTSATFTLTGGRTVIPTTYSGWPVVTAQRNTIPVFGVGLFEFVSDEEIVSRADPDDADADGISGRYNTDFGDIGRLGVKAQSFNIERFTRAPLQNQMGITSDPVGGAGSAPPLRVQPQVSADPDAPTIDHDGVDDPEIGAQDLADLITFSRFLAPPPRRALDAEAQRGEATFDAMGCTKCHVPTLPSSRGLLHAYTDLLIHDMGSDLADGISFGQGQQTATQPITTENEFRTQPLWGVSMHGPFLHDGRAQTLFEAVDLHDGEARASRDAFIALPATERADVIHFLEML